MKKMFTAVFATGLLAVTASAQDSAKVVPAFKPMMGMNKEARMKMMQQRKDDLEKSFKDVGATDDQVKSLSDVFEESMKKQKDLRQDPSFASLTEEDKKAKMKEISEAREAKVKEILGEEKFKQWKENRKKQKKEMSAAPPVQGLP